MSTETQRSKGVCRYHARIVEDTLQKSYTKTSGIIVVMTEVGPSREPRCLFGKGKAQCENEPYDWIEEHIGV